MSVQDQYLAYVLEQLAALGSLRSNRMFGGIGLYSRELFFGLIDDDTLYFKTDESNIEPYRERNMPRFMPFPDRPEAVLGYHQVPADVIEDAERLVDWARKSVEVALRFQVAKATTAHRPARAARNPAQPARKSTKPARAPATTNTRKAPRRKPAKRKQAKATPATRRSATRTSTTKKTATSKPATRRAKPAARRSK